MDTWGWQFFKKQITVFVVALGTTRTYAITYTSNQNFTQFIMNDVEIFAKIWVDFKEISPHKFKNHPQTCLMFIGKVRNLVYQAYHIFWEMACHLLIFWGKCVFLELGLLLCETKNLPLRCIITNKLMWINSNLFFCLK